MEEDDTVFSGYLKDSFIADRRKAVIKLTIFILSAVTYGAIQFYYFKDYSVGQFPHHIWYATFIFFSGWVFLFDCYWFMMDINGLKQTRAKYSGNGNTRLHFLKYSYVILGAIAGIFCVCYFLTMRIPYTPYIIKNELGFRSGNVALAAVLTSVAYHIFMHMMVLREARFMRGEYLQEE